MSTSAANLSYALEHENEFDRLEEQSQAKGYEAELEFRTIFLKKGETLLDAGSGSGFLARDLARQNPYATVIGCDASHQRISKSAEASQGIRNLSFITSDLTDLAFENDFFDVIVCRYVFHHLTLEKRDQVIRELFRCLKPGGRIISADPDGLFYNLKPMPEVVSHVLAIVEASGRVDLFAGSKIPRLYLQAGFESPKFRTEILAGDSHLLFQETKLWEQKFGQLMQFLEDVVKDVVLANQFRDVFLRALATEGTVYYCPKVITSAVKPVLH